MTSLESRFISLSPVKAWWFQFAMRLLIAVARTGTLIDRGLSMFVMALSCLTKLSGEKRFPTIVGLLCTPLWWYMAQNYWITVAHTRICPSGFTLSTGTGQSDLCATQQATYDSFSTRTKLENGRVCYRTPVGACGISFLLRVRQLANQALRSGNE